MADVNPWNRALVTGASSGIGRELCRKLAAGGTDLVVTARRKERLEELAAELSDVDVEIIIGDLADPADVEALATRIANEERPIDLVINNAGSQTFGAFAETDIKAERRVIEINTIALHRLCHAAAGVMTKRGRGAILNVSSIISFAPYPRSATYGGTKAFVTNFTGALKTELAPKGITVSALCPGPVRTEIQGTAEMSFKGVPKMAVTDLGLVAETALKDLANNKTVIVPGVPMKMVKAIIKFAPASFTRWASGYISSQR